MTKYPELEPYSKREIFPPDLSFDVFENAIEEAIYAQQNAIEDLNEQRLDLKNQLSDYGEEGPTPEDIELQEEINETYIDQYWAEEHLTVIGQMKIVYLFRSVEIGIKSLIKQAYPKTSTKMYYQWDNIVSFFKGIDMDISGLDGYSEVQELRKVNNAIKHADETNEITGDLIKIKELKDGFFNFDNLEEFYARIKPKTVKFIETLTNGIKRDLFTFDNTRIDNLVTDYSERMDKETLEKFAKKLLDKSK